MPNDRVPRPPGPFRRSLAVQGVVLALSVTLVTAFIVGRIEAGRMARRLAGELDRRGSATGAMLERNKDLHDAVLRRDADATGQVLQLLVANDVEMEYAGLLDPKGRLLAAAARDASDPVAVVQAQLHDHPLDTPGLANSDESIRRFTQAVAADEGEKGVWAGADAQLYAAGTTIGYLVLGMKDRGGALARGHTAVTVAGVGVALAAAFLVFFLALAARLRRILRFAERLAEQDLSADLLDPSADEVGRVAGALRGIRDRTRQVVADLAGAAGALQASSTAVHESAQAESAGAREQVRRIAEIEASVQELERSSRRAGDGAESVIRSGERSGRDSDEGKRAVVASVEAVEVLRGEVVSTAETLRQLSIRSARIDEIARTVEDVAENSHVLAINTGIEAARAGAEGAAFGIVAREMRELADSSKRATARVRTMLSEIARAAEVSRTAAASGHDRADVAVEQARKAARSIDGLSHTLAAFAEEAVRIAGDASQQASAIQVISDRIGGLRTEADRVASGTAALEDASREIMVRADRLHATVASYRREGPAQAENPGQPKYVSLAYSSRSRTVENPDPQGRHIGSGTSRGPCSV